MGGLMVKLLVESVAMIYLAGRRAAWEGVPLPWGEALGGGRGAWGGLGGGRRRVWWRRNARPSTVACGLFDFGVGR